MKRIIDFLRSIWKKFVNWLKPKQKVSGNFPVLPERTNPNVLVVGEFQRAGLNIFNIETKKEVFFDGRIFFDELYNSFSWNSEEILFYGQIGLFNCICQENIKKVVFIFKKINNFYSFEGTAFGYMVEKIRPYSEISSYEKNGEYLVSIKGMIFSFEDLKMFAKTIFDEINNS